MLNFSHSQWFDSITALSSWPVLLALSRINHINICVNAQHKTLLRRKIFQPDFTACRITWTNVLFTVHLYQIIRTRFLILTASPSTCQLHSGKTPLAFPNFAAPTDFMLSVKMTFTAWTFKPAKWQLWHTAAMSVHIYIAKSSSIILHYLSLESSCLSQLSPQREFFHLPVSVPAFSSHANRWHTREHFWRVPAEAAFQKHYIHNHTTPGEQTAGIHSKNV